MFDTIGFCGIFLAAGWGWLLKRGQAGPGPVIGSAILAVAWMAGALGRSKISFGKRNRRGHRKTYHAAAGGSTPGHRQ